ncbi:MAG: glutamine amidotransferase [Planctomycetota bacterium]|jgi:GMP synthase (glutamine-hydrolysing)|nr:glutamine amidotransferase [Planctomycetota bacterium]
MRPVLILQTGDAPDDIRSRHGNFDDMFLHMGGLDAESATVVHIAKGEDPGDPGDYRGCIVTGSNAMVTDRDPWSENAADWLRAAHGHSLPILAVCYGHQLLARALGGTIDYLPGGQEAGTLELTLDLSCMHDPLLAGFPPRFPVNLTHSQTVVEIPRGSWVMAGSERDKRQILVYGSLIYGVQFHPEFGGGVMRDYLDLAKREEPERRDEFESLSSSASETPLAVLLLRRFISRLPDRRPVPHRN